MSEPQALTNMAYATELRLVAVNSRINNSYSPLGVSFKHIEYVMKCF
jgi:hypothetical protein